MKKRRRMMGEFPCSGLATCLGCLMLRRGRESVKGHRLRLWQPVRAKWAPRVEMTDMKKPEMAIAAAKATNGLFPDDGWVKKWPAVCQYLSDGIWDDGTPRERSALSVFTEDGVVKVALNDKDLMRSAYASGPSFDRAMSALEKGLADGSASWRQWKEAGKKKK